MVFLADDPRLQRRIALKTISPRLMERADMREGFIKEARVVAALEHDNIVTIFEVNQDRGVPYLAMPLLRGCSLHDRLQAAAGPLPLREILRIGREACAALAAAHDRGLVRRDIKPGNIWLEASPGRESGDFRVKILDFGLAQAMQHAEADSGKIVGTPAFMAPEQAQAKATDARADLFSIGCVLYCMAAGQAPFQGQDTINLLFNVAMKEPIALGELNSALPVALVDLIVKLLAKKPEDRPASAHAVIEAIQGIEESLRPKPSRLRWWLASGAAVLVAVGLAYWLLPREPAAPIVPPEPGEVTFVYDEPDQLLSLVHGDDPPIDINLATATTQSLLPGDYQVRSKTPRKGRRLVPDNIVVEPGKPLKVELRLVGEVRKDRWHSRAVWAVALSPKKGDLLAVSASDDRTIRWWDVARDDSSNLLGEHNGPVRCVAVSADGRQVLSGGGAPGPRADLSVQLWELSASGGRKPADSKAIPPVPVARFLAHQHFVTALAFAPDGKRFLSGAADGVAYIWDIKTRLPMQTLSGHERGEIYGAMFAPDGTRALTCGRDKKILLWDADKEKLLKSLAGHTDVVRQVAFAPNGAEAASASWDGSVRIWDLQTEKFREIRGYSGPVHCVAYTPAASPVPPATTRTAKSLPPPMPWGARA